MKYCPHCAGEVAELAVVCPHCRSAISPEAGSRRAAAAALVESAERPEPVGFLVLGGIACLLAVGMIAAGDDGWDIAGLLLGLLGFLTALTGVVAIGVYVGMRNFEHWQRTGRE